MFWLPNLARAGAPAISAIPDQVTDEDMVTAWIEFLAYDSETGELLPGVSGVSSKLDLLPNQNILLTSMGESWFVKLVPGIHQFGTAAVTLTATNEAGLSASTTFQLTVLPVNQPPTLNPIANLVLPKNSGPQTVPLSGISAGPTNEPQELTVSATAAPAGLVTTLQVNYASPASTGSLSFAVVSNATGVATVTVVVDDGAGSNNLCRQSFTVSVPATNYPPTLFPISDVTVQEDTVSSYVSYTLTDAESDFQLVQVTAHSSNPDLLPDENIEVVRAGYSGLIMMTPLPNSFGTAQITVTATDPDGGSSSTTFQFTVVPVNDPPTLDPIPDLVVDQNAGLQTVPLTGISSGATNEFQTLTVSAFATPPGILGDLQINYTSPNSTGVLSFTTLSDVTGQATIAVFVEDGQAWFNLALQIFQVQVIATNQPPVISSIADPVTDIDTPKIVSFTINDAETPAADLVLEAASSNPALAPVENLVFGGAGSDRTLTITPSAGQSGTSTITVTVTDAAGAQAARAFTLIVRPDAFVPIITAQPQGQTAAVGATVTLSVTASGAEPLSYQWQHNGSDLEGEKDSILALTNVQATDAGEYTVIVTNTAGAVTSAVAQVRVLIAPQISQFSTAAGPSFSCLSISGLTYRVEFKNTLEDAQWTVLDVKTGTGDVLQFSDPSAKLPMRFYRIRVE